MVNKLTKLVAFALLIILTSLTLTTPAKATVVTTVNEVTPISVNVFNPCSGELLTLTGTLHTVRTVIFSDSGQTSIYYHFQRNLSGLSLAGVSYYGSGINQGHASFSSPEDKPYETTSVTTLRIISQGAEDNFLLHVNSHLTVNADGTITVSHNFFSSQCR